MSFDIGAQEIDDTILNIYRIVVIALSVTDKVNQAKFFKKTFLIANISSEIIFKIFFLILSIANIDFLD